MFSSITAFNLQSTIINTGTMKIKNAIVKFMCCCNLTLGARLIAFVGVAIAAALASVLLRDKSGNNYDASRKLASLMGLDWQHFHHSANATESADPDGQMISIIVIFYSILYLTTSMSLIYATIFRKRWLTLPWLLCESLGCLSKVAALIFHSIYASKQYNKSFVIGSIVYIVIMTWWWLVVLAAQASWKNENSATISTVPLTTSYIRADSIDMDIPRHIQLYHRRELTQQTSTMDSPRPYILNDTYTCI